jgi:predicted ATP-dependent protease
MPKPKTLPDGRAFTIYLDNRHLQHVKRMARQMSCQEGRDISTCEAIRMALEQIYPMEKQLELFETKKQAQKREYEEKNQFTLIM